MRNVYIEAGIDEIDIGKITAGQQASIRAEAYPDHIYQGEIVRIAPEARLEQNVTLFDVVIQVENTDANLKSGMNTSVEIVIVERPDVLTIPVSALQKPSADEASRSVESPPTVLVKDGDTYRLREIRTGTSDHRVIEVVDGLEEGEVVGIPMVSRLKQEHDLLDARVRRSRSFGGGDRGDRRAKGREG